VGFSPGIAEPERIARLTFRRAGEPVMGGDETFLPTHIACGNRPPQAHPLDLDPNLGQVAQFRAGDGRGPETPLRLRDYETFRGQPRERLPHRAEADGEGLAEIIDPQLLTRPEPAGEQIGAKLSVSLVSEARAIGLIGHERRITYFATKIKQKNLFFIDS
jgi:hypothetical protein